MPRVQVVTIVKKVKVRRKPNKGPDANPRKPLSMANRETFCQLVAKGVKLQEAYRQAGYQGNESARRRLRCQPDIDARVMALLERQIEDDAKARHKRETPAQDRKARILSELEAIAFSDIRDTLQWTTEPVFNDQGEQVGFRPKATLTPSHMLAQSQAAGIKRVFFKAGELNVEWQDKSAALEKLAKIEGLFTDGPSILNDNRSQTVINVGSDNAREAIKRLAFALAKAKEHQELSAPMIVSYAEPEHSEE